MKHQDCIGILEQMSKFNGLSIHVSGYSSNFAGLQMLNIFLKVNMQVQLRYDNNRYESYGKFRLAVISLNCSFFFFWSGLIVQDTSQMTLKNKNCVQKG